MTPCSGAAGWAAAGRRTFCKRLIAHTLTLEAAAFTPSCAGRADRSSCKVDALADAVQHPDSIICNGFEVFIAGEQQPA